MVSNVTFQKKINARHYTTAAERARRGAGSTHTTTSTHHRLTSTKTNLSFDNTVAKALSPPTSSDRVYTTTCT